MSKEIRARGRKAVDVSKKGPTKIRRSGAYVIKAAETRSSRVQAKSSGSTHVPSGRDKVLVNALIKNKRAD